MAHYIKNLLAKIVLRILTIGSFFPCLFATVSLETLDTHSFEHILSFLPLKDIVHSREICHQVNHRCSPETLARIIDTQHKKDQRDYFAFDFSVKQGPIKLLQISEFFTPVSFPFLRINIKDKSFLFFLHSKAFNGKLKNVKSLVLSSNSHFPRKLENFVNIIKKTGLTNLKRFYLNSYEIAPEEVSRTLAVLPKLKGFGITIDSSFMINYNPEVLVKIGQSPYVTQYTHLILPSIKFFLSYIPRDYKNIEEQRRNLENFRSFRKLKTLIFEWDFINPENLNKFKNALPCLENIYTTLENNRLIPPILSTPDIYMDSYGHPIHIPSINYYPSFADCLFHYQKQKHIIDFSSEKNIYLANKYKIARNCQAVLRQAVHT